ncbi:hypothetical protein IVB16_29440 [Bradyrhizobium sp. 183]|uniref:hypothetical protein n=1 Tax=unclassified Bradyrhizobium TaxID=2631580 RepID=UPI001FFE72DB|nr:MULTISPECIES: hypothetical protein [unclassified Bradyrhizobium]UPJ78943.1 hypothetical protein IVB17_29445 [Bradyrhizobium sp. 184]UPJ86736.1 hypothetical protein IVB16_29440 [Bradyrhizobium sp. 183]
MIASSIASYFLFACIARALSFVNVLLFARAMTPADFGIYAFFQASANLIVVFTTLNLPTPMTVVLARGGGKRLQLENAVLCLVFLGAVSLALIASVLCFYFAVPQMPFGSDVLVWFLVFSSMSSLQLLSGAALVARGERLNSAIAVFLSAVLLCVALTVARDLSLAQAMRLGALSVSLGASISFLMLLSGGLNYDARYVATSLLSFLRRDGRGILIFSVLSFGASLSFQFGLWFLQRQLLAHAGAMEGAIFALGNQFYNVMLFLPGIFGPLLLRRLSRQERESQQIQEVFRAGSVALVVSVLGVVTFIAAAPLILLLMPQKYQVGVDPLALGLLAGAIMFAKAPFSVFFQARVSAAVELFSSLAAAGILLAGASIPIVVSNAIDSLWMRAAAHFVLFLVMFSAFIFRWISLPQSAR